MHLNILTKGKQAFQFLKVESYQRLEAKKALMGITHVAYLQIQQ